MVRLMDESPAYRQFIAEKVREASEIIRPENIGTTTETQRRLAWQVLLQHGAGVE